MGIIRDCGSPCRAGPVLAGVREALWGRARLYGPVVRAGGALGRWMGLRRGECALSEGLRAIVIQGAQTAETFGADHRRSPGYTRFRGCLVMAVSSREWRASMSPPTDAPLCTVIVQPQC